MSTFYSRLKRISIAIAIFMVLAWLASAACQAVSANDDPRFAFAYVHEPGSPHVSVGGFGYAGDVTIESTQGTQVVTAEKHRFDAEVVFQRQARDVLERISVTQGDHQIDLTVTVAGTETRDFEITPQFASFLDFITIEARGFDATLTHTEVTIEFNGLLATWTETAYVNAWGGIWHQSRMPHTLLAGETIEVHLTHPQEDEVLTARLYIPSAQFISTHRTVLEGETLTIQVVGLQPYSMPTITVASKPVEFTDAWSRWTDRDGYYEANIRLPQTHGRHTLFVATHENGGLAYTATEVVVIPE